MAAVEWLPEALADLKRLFEFLREKNPEAAARAIRTILDRTDLLAVTPRIGRPMQDNTGRRDLSITFGAGAYIVRYMLDDDETIVIVRIWHSREERR